MEIMEFEGEHMDEHLAEPHRADAHLPRKKMKPRSVVWDHFKKFVDPIDGRTKAKCNYCEKCYICDAKKNGTSTLKYHMNICRHHPHEQHTRQSKLQFSSMASSDDGEGDGGEVNSITDWEFSQEKSRKGLAEMIIVDGLPFSFVENQGLRDFLAALNPHFVIPSRTDVILDCYAIYLEERSKLKKQFENCYSRVSLSLDWWTSMQGISYMALIAHYIDDQWKLQMRILNFMPVPSDEGETIGNAVDMCLQDWGIDCVFAITLEDASSNDQAISYLKEAYTQRGKCIMQGKLLHVRCIAHIINLVVQDCLKQVGASVARVRSAVRYVESCPSRLKKFKGYVETEKLEYKQLLCLDVPSRWNSTFFMLDTAEKMQKAFERYEKEDANCRVELDEEREREEDEMEVEGGYPIQDDWVIVRRLGQFLRHFFEFTLRVSRRSSVTSNQFFDEITDVDFLLKEWMMSGDPELNMMSIRMKAINDKYLGNTDEMNLLLFLAIVVDPRHKLDFVEFAVQRMFDGEKGIQLSRRVREALYEMFEEYKKMPQPTDSPQSQPLTLPSEMPQGPETHETVRSQMKKLYKRKKIESGGGEFKSELDKYLNDTNEEDRGDFDILGWWRKNNSRYPIIASMARDLLAVPFSSLASESAFSIEGRVLDAFQSSLTPKTLQALVCARDWLRGGPIRVEEELDNLEDLEEEFEDMLPFGFESTIIDML